MNNTEFVAFLQMVAALAPSLLPRIKLEAMHHQAEIRIAAFEAIPRGARTLEHEVVLGTAFWLMYSSPSVEEMELLANRLSALSECALACEHDYWGTKSFEDLDELARKHFAALLIEFELTKTRSALFDEERRILGLDTRLEKVMREFEKRLSRRRGTRRAKQRVTQANTAS